LPKAVIDLGNSEFAAGLSFVAVSRVRALTDLLFDVAPTLERLQKIKQSTRLQERIDKEERLMVSIWFSLYLLCFPEYI